MIINENILNVCHKFDNAFNENILNVCDKFDNVYNANICMNKRIKTGN